LARPKETRGPRAPKTLYLNPDTVSEFEDWLRRTTRISLSEYFNNYMEDVVEEDERKQQQKINETQSFSDDILKV
jgi:hypothetical protein